MRLHPARAAGLLRAPWTPAWAKDELWRRARAVPSLDLRFAESKSLVDSVSGQNLITFTRASTGTYVDSDGVIRSAANDIPRFDHNPLTGECLGLLVEEQRQNLLLRSEEFDNASWNNKVNGAVTQNSAASPSGTTTADRFVPTAMASLPFIAQSATVVSGTTYTWSVFLKADGYSWVFLDAFDGSNHRTWFNLSTGTIGTVEAGNTSTITPFGNGWYRCTITRSAGGTSIPYAVAVVSGNNALNITANGTSGILLWGAQLEAGAFPTSYIKTEAAAATRTADIASITTAGGNVRSLFTSFRSPASGTRPVVSLDDNTANERIEILTSGTDPKLLVTDGGSAVADLDAGTVTANVLARIAARFNTDDYAVSINGGTSQLDAAGALPTVNRIRIGSNQAGGYLSGSIARVTAWDSALPMLPPISG
jgi:hypothetical protein